MSGLGGHQQESWVLIHFTRKVEIGKEACKTKGEKKKNPAETLYEKGERNDETDVVRYYSAENQTGKTLGNKKREPTIPGEQ